MAIETIQLFESTIHPIIIKMIIQIDSTGTESLQSNVESNDRNFSWIVQYQWSSTIYQMFNQMIIHFLSNSQIHWSSNVYNWWWTGHWLILKWSSTDWSNDHMIQWLHDPLITWSNNPSFYFFQRWLSTNLSNSPSISIYKLKSYNYFHSSCRSGHQPNSSRTAYFN